STRHVPAHLLHREAARLESTVHLFQKSSHRKKRTTRSRFVCSTMLLFVSLKPLKLHCLQNHPAEKRTATRTTTRTKTKTMEMMKRTRPKRRHQQNHPRNPV